MTTVSMKNLKSKKGIKYIFVLLKGDEASRSLYTEVKQLNMRRGIDYEIKIYNNKENFLNKFQFYFFEEHIKLPCILKIHDYEGGINE